MPMNPGGGAVYTEIQYLSQHFLAGESPFSFKSFLAAPSSACLAVSMMSIVFSTPQRNFIWIGGNLQIKL
jgi:hypothetical protein